jgi:hypothetical protein
MRDDMRMARPGRVSPVQQDQEVHVMNPDPTQGAVVADRSGLRDGVRDAIARVAHRRDVDVERSLLASDHPADASPTLAVELQEAQAHVVRYVSRRRNEGASIERLQAELHLLVRDATSYDGRLDRTETLTQAVVRWAVSAYYDEPALRHVPRFY